MHNAALHQVISAACRLFTNQEPHSALWVLCHEDHVLDAHCWLWLHIQVALSEVEAGAEPPLRKHFLG